MTVTEFDCWLRHSMPTSWRVFLMNKLLWRGFSAPGKPFFSFFSPLINHSYMSENSKSKMPQLLSCLSALFLKDILSNNALRVHCLTHTCWAVHCALNTASLQHWRNEQQQIRPADGNILKPRHGAKRKSLSFEICKTFLNLVLRLKKT